MPQLDLGIFYIEFFLNFFCFWLIYILKAKKIFPFLNKTIKLRKYKIKELNIFLNIYIESFSNLNLCLENYKNIFNIFLLKKINFYFLKLKYIYILFLKNYYNFFIIKNNKIFYNFIYKQLFLNKI